MLMRHEDLFSLFMEILLGLCILFSVFPLTSSGGGRRRAFEAIEHKADCVFCCLVFGNGGGRAVGWW
jgi:hypothetical protein